MHGLIKHEYISNLTNAITAVLECPCRHFETSYVREEINGKLVWEGNVELFHVDGHAEATIVYGWSVVDENDRVHYIGILNRPPVDSPAAAIRAAMASDFLG